MDTRKRSLAKAITFRIVATVTTVVLVLLITGDITLAGVIGLVDLISKLIIYYLHERAWEKISWGKIIPKIL